MFPAWVCLKIEEKDIMNETQCGDFLEVYLSQH